MHHFNCAVTVESEFAVVGTKISPGQKSSLQLFRARDDQRSIGPQSRGGGGGKEGIKIDSLPFHLDDKAQKALSNVVSIDAGSSSTATLMLASSSSSTSRTAPNTYLLGLKLDKSDNSSNNSCNLLLSIPPFISPSSPSSISSFASSTSNSHNLVALDVQNSRCALADADSGEIALIDLTPSSSGGSPSMVAWRGSISCGLGSGATSVMFWKHSPSVLLSSGGPALLAFQGLPHIGGGVKALDVRQSPSSRPIFFSVATQQQLSPRQTSSFSSSNSRSNFSPGLRKSGVVTSPNTSSSSSFSSSSSSSSILSPSPFSLVTCLTSHVSDPFAVYGGTDDGSVVKWDVRKAQYAIESVPNVHVGPITGILTTPSNDLVTSGNDGTISSIHCASFANAAAMKKSVEKQSLLTSALGLNGICWLQTSDQRRIDEKGDGVILSPGEGGLEFSLLKAQEVEEFVDDTLVDEFGEPLEEVVEEFTTEVFDYQSNNLAEEREGWGGGR